MQRKVISVSRAAVEVFLGRSRKRRKIKRPSLDRVFFSGVVGVVCWFWDDGCGRKWLSFESFVGQV